MGMYYRCDACNKELPAADIQEVCFNYKARANSGICVREVCNGECAAVVLERFAKELRDKHKFEQEHRNGR